MNRFSFFLMTIITTRFFMFRLKLKLLKNGRGGTTISNVRGFRKTYFSKVFSLVSPAGPIMVGAKGGEKNLNSKGSRSSENATFFEYFLNYLVKILQQNVNLLGRNQNNCNSCLIKLCFKALDTTKESEYKQFLKPS